MNRSGGDAEALDAAVDEALGRGGTDAMRANVYLRAGWTAYGADNHVKAASLFDQAVAITPDDELAGLYAARGWNACSP